MKNYKFSIFYSIILIIASYFHFQLENWFRATGSKNFILYLIYAFFLAFFISLFFKKFSKINNMEITIILLAIGFIFFLLFSRPILSFQLCVLELFILGVILALEKRKSRSSIPFIILLITAILIEISFNFSIGSHFFYMNAWRNGLIGLSGYLTGFLWI